MRFAGEKVIKSESRRSYDALQDKPVVPGFNAEDLVDTPEMAPGKYFSGQDLLRDKYIQQDPRSGVANASQDQSQWPSIKDASSKAPTNYRYDEHMRDIVPSIPARLRKA